MPQLQPIQRPQFCFIGKVIFIALNLMLSLGIYQQIGRKIDSTFLKIESSVKIIKTHEIEQELVGQSGPQGATSEQKIDRYGLPSVRVDPGQRPQHQKKCQLNQRFRLRLRIRDINQTTPSLLNLRLLDRLKCPGWLQRHHLRVWADGRR